ncbi:MAG TPA: hypothetical protein VFQ65_22735 [Kofleriaceae bacterium]|nr:hypothetical protein [Kofleriaceae bacterium]
MKTSLLVMLALFVACRGSDSNSSDAAAAHDSKVADGAGSGSNACVTYTVTTIAAMRQQTHTGCYEFDNVISIGTTPSTKAPVVYVQDAGGGDFSAMPTKCSSTSTSHPCSIATTVAAIPDGHSLTIKGTYIKTASTTFEEFFIDTLTDNGAGTAPAPATATLAQISRGSTASNLRFQHVTVTLATPLTMYDWTPSEFANTTATACPYQFGFGMIPMGTAGATPGAACTTGTTQPAGVTSPNAAEVLIGTDFFKGFTVSSDCRCAKTFTDKEPAMTSTLSGTIGGILVFEVPFQSTNGYYYLAPKTLTDAPITNTVAGM